MQQSVNVTLKGLTDELYVPSFLPTRLRVGIIFVLE